MCTSGRASGAVVGKEPLPVACQDLSQRTYHLKGIARATPPPQALPERVPTILNVEECPGWRGWGMPEQLTRKVARLREVCIIVLLRAPVKTKQSNLFSPASPSPACEPPGRRLFPSASLIIIESAHSLPFCFTQANHQPGHPIPRLRLQIHHPPSK